MFVDLMADIRKTVSEITFKAQLSAPPPRPMAPPRSLTLSGPSDPDGIHGARPVRPAEPPPAESGGGEDAIAAAFSSGARRTPAFGTGPDVARLQTNRSETATATSPVTADKTPGRNDPCWCGSGRKFKKCHGAGQ
jgi:hypothetical protein